MLRETQCKCFSRRRYRPQLHLHSTMDDKMILTRAQRLHAIIKGMLKEQENNKIYGDCFRNAARLFDAIKMNELGDPEFVVGWVLNKHESREAESLNKQLRLRGQRGADYSHVDKDRAFWSFGAHCWVEMNGQVLDASYEWIRLISFNFFKHFNLLT